MSEAAALTEQIAGLLGEHVLAFSAGRCTCSCGSFERVWHYDNGKASHKDHRAHIAEVLAARLADSRPAPCEVHEVELVHRCVNCGDIIQVGSGV